jgi:hypothetical protein
MGDEIEKFHKEALRGVQYGKPACDKLKAALTKYKTGIQNKYKPFLGRIKQQLDYFVEQYINEGAKSWPRCRRIPRCARMRARNWESLAPNSCTGKMTAARELSSPPTTRFYWTS